jgi:hypothetical protein
MNRVIAYIDGFNLYHAIDDIGKPNPRKPNASAKRRPHLKWLNLWSLCESLLQQGEVLTRVSYFSAYATWLPDAHKRHAEYVRALQYFGVTCIMGHFKSKPRSCKTCGAQWVIHEEKETDVHMAASIVVDACENKFDCAIVITADSDLAPALDIVRTRFPKKQLLIVAPPARYNHARSLKTAMMLTPGRLEKHLLPAVAYDANGRPIFTRPSSYSPPP